MFSIDVPRIAVAYIETAIELKKQYQDKNPVIIADNYASFHNNDAYSYAIDIDLIGKQSAFEILFRAAQQHGFAIFVSEDPKFIKLFNIIEYRGGDVYADACRAFPLKFESNDAVTLNIPIPVSVALTGRLPQNDLHIFLRYGAHFVDVENATHVIHTTDDEIDINGKKILAMGDGYKAIYNKMSEKEIIFEDATIRYEHNGWKFGYFVPDYESAIWEYGQIITFITKDEHPKMILTDDITAVNFHFCFEDDKHLAQNFVKL
ncbi:MAG: hypothetical protein IJO16_03875 [Clostridia bacterium]|nr:hypothetical protein [Clostridia bacterium]MBQ7094095.1 hypothetical protein [Clostridia bacterium]